MHAFILAGGFATRLWPLTESRAKPLLPLAGKPMLSHIMEKIPADFPVTISTNAVFAEAFDAWAKTQNRKITILIEDTATDDRKLGTNGAVAEWITKEKIAEDVLLLTGDNYLGFSMETFLADYRDGSPLIAAYDIGNLEDAQKFGTVIANDNIVTAFEEKPKEPKTTLVSTGCYVIPKDCLPLIVDYAKDHPDHLGTLFEEFLRKGKTVRCFTFTEPWFDIGSFSSYMEATKTLVGPQCLLGDNTLLINTKKEGSVVLGERCRVKDSTLCDTVLFDNCRIEDCVLRNCIVDEDCELRGIDLTGQMLRKGTRLVHSTGL